eukprot:5926625-Prymnesium_polylepis.1
MGGVVVKALAEKADKRSSAQPKGSEAARIFRLLDADGNQQLTLEELKTAAAEHAEVIGVKEAWPDDRIKKLLQDYDADKDGMLSLPEFERAVKELGASAPKPAAKKAAAGASKAATGQPAQKAGGRAAPSQAGAGAKGAAPPQAGATAAA